MIDLRFKNMNGREWHTTSFKDGATFAAWLYTFDKAVSHYDAFRNYRLIAHKSPPFYVAVLRWFF